jgi:ubiquinone/menaquinone biosynthesis C-methylase UbiE
MKYDYSDYWQNQFEERKRTRYYEKAYDKIKNDIIPKSNMRILDVGGGNGQFMAYLGIKKATILDISDSGLEFARKKFNFNTVKGDVEKKFPFKDGSFDVVYCCEVLEHLDNPKKTMNEIKRVLWKDGEAVISVPNVKPDGSHHKQWFKIEKLKTLIKDTGLKVVYEYHSPKFNGNESLSGDLRGLSRRLISKIGSIIPYKLRLGAANLGPDIFSSFFVIKAKNSDSS